MRRATNTILADRLRSARLMSGMSQEELSCKVGGISKQSISKYERGMMLPGSSTLIALASALDVDVDYFFRPHIVSDDGFNVSFR